MPDHVHSAVTARSRTLLSDFTGEWTRNFSREHNRVCHLTGPLFEHPFGSAPKYGSKKARTLLIYIGNNPVERQLTSQAEGYRWTFIAYAFSDHPYSEKLVVRESRWCLQKAVKEISACRKAEKPLKYEQLDRLFKPLTQKETLQLEDYIISQYNAIDYPEVLRYFDNSYENLLMSLHSVTGSEYDLNESFLGKTDKPYSQMSKILMEELHFQDIHEFLPFDIDRKWELFGLLRKQTDAMGEQIAKYLHLQLGKADGPSNGND